MVPLLDGSSGGGDGGGDEAETEVMGKSAAGCAKFSLELRRESRRLLKALAEGLPCDKVKVRNSRSIS